MTELELQRRRKIEEEDAAEAELEQRIPRPTGYHILIAMPTVKNTFGDSGIVKANETMHHESILSMVGMVLDMGPQAYSDKDRFPTGPWCQKGDYVMFRSNSGTRFKVAGAEYRLLNDDSIQAVVTDPNGVQRI